MKRVWLLCLAFVPGVAALDEGAPLYLTLEDGCYDLCGGQFDYYWTDTPTGTAGKAPLTISAPAYSPYHANVDLSPEVAIEFTGPGTLSITVGCEAVDPGVDATFTWDIRLIAGDARDDFRDSLPQPCLADAQTIEFPIDLTGGIVAVGDTLHMSISADTVNPQVASISNLYLVADDPMQPTSIDAPWRFVEANTTTAPIGGAEPEMPADSEPQPEPENPDAPANQDAPSGLVAVAAVAIALFIRRR